MLENNRLNLSQVKLGQPLPDWSIESIFGDVIPTVDHFRGKPLLILFFNLGCPGCVGRAIPFANRMVYENKEYLNVMGIHTNFEGIDFTHAQFQQARETYYMRFPWYRDKNYDTTFLHYGAGGTPHWLLTDQESNVIYSLFGSDPNNALLRLDLKILELIH